MTDSSGEHSVDGGITNEQPLQSLEREQRRRLFKQARERARARAEERRAARAQAEEAQAAEESSLPPSSAMTPAAPRTLDAMRILEVQAPAQPEVRRPPLILAPIAGLTWGGVILLLVLGDLGPASNLTQRMLYALLLVLAGLLTFAPLQWSLRLPALTWRGTVGWGLLFYTLAFVPAPAGWLLALPDLPVYVILMIGVFLALNAAAIPVCYTIQLRLYRQRTLRFDVDRANRQAAEVGFFGAGCVALAAIGALTLISLMLLLAILAVLEIFVLGGREFYDE